MDNRCEDKRIVSPVSDIYVTYHVNTKNTKKINYLQVLNGCVRLLHKVP